jgi:hypothetical protein
MAVKNAQLDKAEAAFAAIEQVSMNLVHFIERAFKRSPLLGFFSCITSAQTFCHCSGSTVPVDLNLLTYKMCSGKAAELKALWRVSQLSQSFRLSSPCSQGRISSLCTLQPGSLDAVLLSKHLFTRFPLSTHNL